jgi:hypothetical protein
MRGSSREKKNKRKSIPFFIHCLPAHSHFVPLIVCGDNEEEMELQSRYAAQAPRRLARSGARSARRAETLFFFILSLLFSSPPEQAQAQPLCGVVSTFRGERRGER